MAIKILLYVSLLVPAFILLGPPKELTLFLQRHREYSTTKAFFKDFHVFGNSYNSRYITEAYTSFRWAVTLSLESEQQFPG
jgi:hypothetical protein